MGNEKKIHVLPWRNVQALLWVLFWCLFPFATWEIKTKLTYQHTHQHKLTLKSINYCSFLGIFAKDKCNAYNLTMQFLFLIHIPTAPKPIAALTSTSDFWKCTKAVCWNSPYFMRDMVSSGTKNLTKRTNVFTLLYEYSWHDHMYRDNKIYVMLCLCHFHVVPFLHSGMWRRRPYVGIIIGGNNKTG